MDGLVSIDKARNDYGVVIEPGTWEIDHAATAKLRGAA
jgi:hypothetical protein